MCELNSVLVVILRHTIWWYPAVMQRAKVRRSCLQACVSSTPDLSFLASMLPMPHLTACASECTLDLVEGYVLLLPQTANLQVYCLDCPSEAFYTSRKSWHALCSSTERLASQRIFHFTRFPASTSLHSTCLNRQASSISIQSSVSVAKLAAWRHTSSRLTITKEGLPVHSVRAGIASESANADCSNR